jgi:hypothetical protein
MVHVGHFFFLLPSYFATSATSSFRETQNNWATTERLSLSLYGKLASTGKTHNFREDKGSFSIPQLSNSIYFFNNNSGLLSL